jgi:hypothetical protein
MARAVHVSPGVRPLEVIIIWSGSIGSIPAGFRLCDGSAGTPNLLDRFVEVPYATTINGPDPGSSNTSVLNHFHHDLDTGDESGHHHTKTASTTQTAFPSLTGVAIIGADNMGNQHVHTYGDFDTSNAAQQHHHKMGYSTRDIQTVSVVPPYYALAYIQGEITDLAVGDIVNFVGNPAQVFRETAGVASYLAATYVAGSGTIHVTAPPGISAPITVKIDGEVFLVDDLGAGGINWNVFFDDYSGSGGGLSNHAAGTPIMWTKYVYCDGSNGSPALMPGIGGGAQFILGAGGLQAVNDQGGGTFVLGGSHVHGAGGVAIADEDEHSHKLIPRLGAGPFTIGITEYASPAPYDSAPTLSSPSLAAHHYHTLTLESEPGTPHHHVATGTGTAIGGVPNYTPLAYFTGFIMRAA